MSNFKIQGGALDNCRLGSLPPSKTATRTTST